MTDTPMHTVPGALDKLQQIYAEGEAMIQANDLEGAVKKFSEGIAIDDQFRQRYITMYAQRAYAHQTLGNTKEAIADYTKAIELETPPENRAQYYFQRGFLTQGLPTESQEEYTANVDSAIADYSSSIELYPNHPGPYHMRGALLVNYKGKNEEALADLNTSLSMQEDGDAYAQRGFAHFNLNHFKEAETDFVRANELAPTPYNEYMLAVIAAKNGDVEGLVTHGKIAVEGNPDFRDYFVQNEELDSFRSNPEFAKLCQG